MRGVKIQATGGSVHGEATTAGVCCLKRADCDRGAVLTFTSGPPSFRRLPCDCRIDELAAILIDSSSPKGLETRLGKEAEGLNVAGRLRADFFALAQKARPASRGCSRASEPGEYRFALSGHVAGRADPGKERRPAKFDVGGLPLRKLKES